MTIGIRHKVIEWYRNKAERRAKCSTGRHFTTYDRYNFREHKKDIRGYINDMTLPPGLWNLNVKMFSDLRLDYILATKFPSDDDKYKKQMRNRLDHLRRLRLFNGTPFGPDDRPFYYDRWSKFVAPDAIPAAERDGVKFHKITMHMFPGRAWIIVQAHESRRRHQGFWTVWPDDVDSPVNSPQPMTFGFESVADFFLFRLTYEYPVLSIQQVAA